MGTRWMKTGAMAGGAALLVLGGLALGGSPIAPQEGANTGTLHVFFSSEAVPALRAIEDARQAKVNVRWTLLLEDFALLRGEPPREFAEFVNALAKSVGDGFGLALHDPEGLALAERLQIARLPAFALVRNARAHVACGKNVSVKEMIACRK